ncbi:AMP-binding protein [Scytonema sp. PCC 10023]|uniref:AMP-binding protein n=1 Tax=Scytonema sp. PCC 10023 TaxID=1680591 RepID=UPI0039C64D09
MVGNQKLAKKRFLNVANVGTFVDILRGRELNQPDQKAFTFLLDGETEEVSLTYQELDMQARAIASYLQSMDARGERALLIYQPSLDFIAAFFGCLYAGVIAVPAYPPRQNQSLSRLQAIVADAQATIALTSTTVLSGIKRQFTELPDLQALHWLATDDISRDLSYSWQQPAIDSDTLAFLQYTSGSTGTPKGVKVTHGNLLHNARIIENAFQQTEKTIAVSWLPLYHDMGLIGNALQPVYLGIPCTLMSPITFLQKPLRWLEAISRYKATTSGAPNFAYDLCVSKITPSERANLDLSSWEVAFSGSEPIRAETLERFTATFESCGFRREAFYPCYGMAEATLLISGGLKTAPPVVYPVEKAALMQNQVVEAVDKEDGVQKIVGCGQTWLDHKIAIVDPESLTLCPSDRVGEIWVLGKSVTQGYWNRSEETEETFHAYLADTGEGPFLRTGDLGFLKNNELFVTGRLKDLIIIRGRNHYPQDIEQAVEQSNPALRSSCGAAFSVDVESEERVVIAVEVERSHLKKLDVDKVIGDIRQAISQQHELQVYAVLLLKTGSIAKTSSGKVQRHACRTGFLNGSLNTVGDWRELLPSELQQTFSQQPHEELQLSNSAPTKEAIQAWLLSNLAMYLKVQPNEIDIREPLTRYGLDSSVAVSLMAKLAEWLDCKLSVTIIWQYPTIAALAEYLAKKSSQTQLASQEDTEEWS